MDAPLLGLAKSIYYYIRYYTLSVHYYYMVSRNRISYRRSQNGDR